MGKGFYISKLVAIVGVVVALAAVATIIALAVVYSQEKAKSEDLAKPTITSTAKPATTSAAKPTNATTEPSTTPSTPKEPWQRYRLPDSLSPVSYSVTLRPRLQPETNGLFIFTGNSTVIFRCVNATDLIIIHSYKLNLTSSGGHYATLTGLNGANTPSITKSWLEVPTQFLVIQLSNSLMAGGTYELRTTFTGELSDDLGGFYRSVYTEDNVQKYEAFFNFAKGNLF